MKFLTIFIFATAIVFALAHKHKHHPKHNHHTKFVHLHARFDHHHHSPKLDSCMEKVEIESSSQVLSLTKGALETLRYELVNQMMSIFTVKGNTYYLKTLKEDAGSINGKHLDKTHPYTKDQAKQWCQFQANQLINEAAEAIQKNASLNAVNYALCYVQESCSNKNKINGKSYNDKKYHCIENIQFQDLYQMNLNTSDTNLTTTFYKAVNSTITKTLSKKKSDKLKLKNNENLDINETDIVNSEIWASNIGFLDISSIIDQVSMKLGENETHYNVSEIAIDVVFNKCKLIQTIQSSTGSSGSSGTS